MNKITRLVLTALFVLGGGAALGKVFIWGESVTNYGAYVPWGLWIGLYVFLVATAAGASWFAVYTSRNEGENGSLTQMSLVTAGAALLFGLAFVGMDLGKPFKGFMIFVSPSFSSKLAWASWLYVLFFIALGGYFLTQAKKAFLYLAGIAAFGFVVAEGLFFAGMVSRVAWNSGLTVASFLASAIPAGAALVCLVAAIQGIAVPQVMRKLLMGSLAVLVAVEIIHFAMAAGGAVEKAAAVKAMWASVPFIGLFLIAGVIVPLFLIWKQETVSGFLAPILILLGTAAYKYSFVRYGFTSEPLPGLTSAYQHARLSLEYSPSLVEWLVAVGFLAGMILVADAAVKKIMPQPR